MNKQAIITKIKQLRLPAGQYVVFGSGPLAAHGIRDSHDIDIAVTTELYQKMKAEGWPEKTWPDKTGHYLVKDGYEITHEWNYGTYRPDIDWLINQAEYIDSIPFVPLTEVLKWKRAYGRDKDKADIKLIEKFLAQKP